MFLHDDRRIRIQSRIRIHTSLRVREARKRVDPDSDPEHWLVPVGLLDVLGCDLLATVHASHRLAQPESTDLSSQAVAQRELNDL
jgi:hypothetical protein